MLNSIKVKAVLKLYLISKVILQAFPSKGERGICVNSANILSALHLPKAHP